MTEIKIAGRNALTPLVILGLAILALLIYLLFSYTTVQENPAGKPSLTKSSIESESRSNTKVDEFVTFIERHSAKTMNHTYAVQGLLKMTAAIRSIASKLGFDVNADLNKVKEYTNKITTSSSKNIEAVEIGKAANTLTDVLVEMQEARFPTLSGQADEFQKSSASISLATETSDRRTSMKAFFGKAANLLERMN